MTRQALAALLFALATLPAGADEDEQDRVLRWRQAGQVLPLETILERFDPERGVQIIEIELEEEEGLPVYEIKYLDRRGRIRKTEIDARTGVPLKDRGH